MSKLADRRKELGLSQSQLAKKAGVNLRSLQSYEQGQRNFGSATVFVAKKISIALECTIEDLLED